MSFIDTGILQFVLRQHGDIDRIS